MSMTYMKLMPTMPKPTTTILLRAPTAIFGVKQGWSQNGKKIYQTRGSGRRCEA